MKIKFIGAAREVTGSKTLITTEQGENILLDCGMFQGKGLETDRMNRHLGVDAKNIDYVLLSHAHIDHSGLIPYLYKSGFRGSVISTHATRNLCSIMLADSGHIQELDALWFNKKQIRKNLPTITPLYSVEDAEKCIKLFIGVEYNRRFRITDDIHVKFTNTGHMLGGGVVNLEIKERGNTTNIAYTGDIGRPENRILQSPVSFPQCDYLITESTYGNRLHESVKDMEAQLLKNIKETCIINKGKLIIPAFAIGRTQEIVYLLNKFHNEGKIPKIKVYVDSPLAVNATDIFRMHLSNLNKDVKKVLETDPDPFGFNSLYYIKRVEESKAINEKDEPCIIISASGMAEAGRIKHHIANNISNPTNTIMMVGYCTPSSLGARLQEPGLKEISIFGKMYDVKAKITKIEAFSGHADYEEMIRFLECQSVSDIKKTFLVHGEYEVQQAYQNHLLAVGFQNVEIPASGSEYKLK